MKETAKKVTLSKLASFLLMTAMLSPLVVSSTQASMRSAPGDKPDSNTSAQPNERLKADMLKLVADAKSGKMRPSLDPPVKPPQSNHLSKGAKIGIGVGIAAAVVLIVLIANRPRNSK